MKAYSPLKLILILLFISGFFANGQETRQQQRRNEWSNMERERTGNNSGSDNASAEMFMTGLETILGRMAIEAQKQQALMAERSAAEKEYNRLKKDCLEGDCQNGYGRLKLSQRDNTYMYSGEFNNGRYHGDGKFRNNANNTFYEGQFEFGKQHGHGIFYLPNTTRYEGDFTRGKITGQGKYYYPSGSILLQGYFQDAKFQRGKSFHPNGQLFYEGLWKNNYPEARNMVLYKRDGSTLFEGSFENDLRKGKGTIYTEEGDQLESIWHRNRNGVVRYKSRSTLIQNSGKRKTYRYFEKEANMEGDFWSFDGIAFFEINLLSIGPSPFKNIERDILYDGRPFFRNTRPGRAAIWDRGAGNILNNYVFKLHVGKPNAIDIINLYLTISSRGRVYAPNDTNLLFLDETEEGQLIPLVDERPFYLFGKELAVGTTAIFPIGKAMFTAEMGITALSQSKILFTDSSSVDQNLDDVEVKNVLSLPSGSKFWQRFYLEPGIMAGPLKVSARLTPLRYQPSANYPIVQSTESGHMPSPIRTKFMSVDFNVSFSIPLWKWKPKSHPYHRPDQILRRNIPNLGDL